MGRRRSNKKDKDALPTRKRPRYQQMLLQMGRWGNFIGRAGELRVERAFQHPGAPSWLFGLRPATPSEDSNGIDAFAITDVGQIPLQIKTSVEKEEPPGNPDLHPPRVHINLTESDVDIRKKVARAVQEIRQKRMR